MATVLEVEEAIVKAIQSTVGNPTTPENTAIVLLVFHKLNRLFEYQIDEEVVRIINANKK